jgi:NitT/TauT family transport system permease protein
MQNVLSEDKKQAKRKHKKISLPKYVWLIISLVVGLGAWELLSIYPITSNSFPSIVSVIKSISLMLSRGVFIKDLSSSLFSVIFGFIIGFVIALPVAILMAWYHPIENIIGPWIQFVRSIPPLAYVPLVVVSAGVGAKSQIIVITIATFLVMSITIYQGVINIDPVLIKAARVLGAKDRDIFLRVIVPASTPFIITAVRLGATTALTTLIAAESTGAQAGLGMRIRALSQYFETAPMFLYIVIIGIIGLLIDKGIRLLEKRLTRWQEKTEA